MTILSASMPFKSLFNKKYHTVLIMGVFGFLISINRYYKIFETSSSSISSPLPKAPTIKEKELYTNSYSNYLNFFSVIGFTCVTISATKLYIERIWLYPLFLLLAYTVSYFLISLRINLFPRKFNLKNHQRMVKNWRPRIYPTIDVFLPTCGEPLHVIKNTWNGVYRMKDFYPGKVKVYCLDDAHSPKVRQMAKKYKFHYLARKNKGWFKKAGNLRHGFANSNGDFIVILDADFKPRKDFINELLPYFYQDKKLGIVQTPQFFSVSDRQNWLERGAGAVQEFFYRAVQVSRQIHGGAICVGSNAIYRRQALNSIGGTALIEHSEDVHTGFELRRKGWHLLYVPVVLAKGLCPSELRSFFKQQYRWCMGSMSLLTSAKFWSTKLPLKSRLCYWCGFMYYIHTAIYVIFTPIIPLIMLFLLPEQIILANYFLIFPAFAYTQIIFPFWHKSRYGIETASVKLIYGWAHLFALIDCIIKNSMEWQPTGALIRKKDLRHNIFRICVIWFNLFPAIIWILASTFYFFRHQSLDFLPILLFGIYYFFTVIKVVMYRD